MLFFAISSEFYHSNLNDNCTTHAQKTCNVEKIIISHVLFVLFTTLNYWFVLLIFSLQYNPNFGLSLFFIIFMILNLVVVRSQLGAFIEVAHTIGIFA